MTRIRLPPAGLVAGQVGFDLCCALTERTRELAHLGQLTVTVEGVAVDSEGVAEAGVGHYGGVPDPVQRVQTVAHPNRVQPVPAALSPYPRVDLQMQMPVRITRTGRVVPHRYRLDRLNRHLDLATARADPGGRVLREPADNLLRRPLLRRVISP